jgi:DNA-binding transcriptional regulator LsrR (DeoR family)
MTALSAAQGEAGQARSLQPVGSVMDIILRLSTVEETSAPREMKRFTIDVPVDLHRRIKTACAAGGTIMADEIRAMLEEKFK